MGANRRTILIGTSAVGVSTALVACGGRAQEPTDDSNKTTDTATGAAQGGSEALAKVSDVPVGGGMVLVDQQIVLTQPTPGEIKGFTSSCTHYGCTVQGVSGGTINCPCHGSKFDMVNGAVRNGPAVGALPAVAIKVEGDEIFRAGM